MAQSLVMYFSSSMVFSYTVVYPRTHTHKNHTNRYFLKENIKFEVDFEYLKIEYYS